MGFYPTRVTDDPAFAGIKANSRGTLPGLLRAERFIAKDNEQNFASKKNRILVAQKLSKRLFLVAFFGN
jgi:hypothetical protein